MTGRGRGESPKVAEFESSVATRYAVSTRPPSRSSTEGDEAGNTDSSSNGEKIIRGRGGFRGKDLCTIPANLDQASLRASPTASDQQIYLMSNFVKIKPMKDRSIFAYRVEFEPDIKSISLRKSLLRKKLGDHLLFDGVSDAYSSSMIETPVSDYTVEHPDDPQISYKITLKHTGTIQPGSFEIIRIYNMHMRKCLVALNFLQVSRDGSYVHPSLRTRIGNSNSIVACRGYKSAFNVHDNGDILMKLEACHKLMQCRNVLEHMEEIRLMGGNLRETVKAMLTGKLVITSYNKIIYRVEDVNFELTPKSSFKDKTGKDVSFIEYFKVNYDVTIMDHNQPLLLVIQNNKRNREEEQGQTREIYVIPELCNIAGLTDLQRNDNRLKTDLIRSSQISPSQRVADMETHMKKLLNSREVHDLLNHWGYSYDIGPGVMVKARLMPIESIGVGRMVRDRKTWPKADPLTGSFEQKVMRESLAEAPELAPFAIIIPRINCEKRSNIIARLKQGMDSIGLIVSREPDIIDLPGDTVQQYVAAIRNVSASKTIIIVVLHNQNKDRYDAIKKLATVERGIVTQVVTVKLLLDVGKANGASIKIGIQIAAKIGGEPWYINIPLVGDMICGYDTYHDTTNRGRSYGAFLASMDSKFSRWYSKADSHDKLDELSAHLAQNLGSALRRFRELNNNKAPKRVFIYRDGVGDGQLEFVYKTELQQIKKAIDDFEPSIKLTFVIVNKKVGARFYMRANGNIVNPTPGSVIDNTVTRKGRYDFYLISQSTRNGTVAPTYYNIIHDESGLDAAKHQTLAFKLCFLYYNWAGTVRVPAPCQYAHKLALLCGEHLHAIPNASLDDRLHFL